MFPKFSTMFVYSELEKSWLLENHVANEVVVYKSYKVKQHTDSIIIFLGLLGSIQDKDLSKIIEFFKLKQYDIYVKLHPLYDKSDYKLPEFDCVEVFDSSEYDSCFSIIESIKPKFSLGAYTTALCESLNAGVIPILFDKDRDLRIIKKHYVFYPYHKKNLSWEKDKDTINNLIWNKADYNRVLDHLTNLK